MKEMIDSEKTSNILIGVGLVGLLAYGYMLIFSEISPENLKYSVLACSFAAFLPFAITIRKITTDYSTGSFWGIVIVVAAIFSFVAYSMMKATEEGFLFDLFAVVSSEGFRWLYLSLLVISTLLPFIWEKGAPYVLAIALGVIIPVILYTIIILVVILIGCYLMFFRLGDFYKLSFRKSGFPQTKAKIDIFIQPIKTYLPLSDVLTQIIKFL